MSRPRRSKLLALALVALAALAAACSAGTWSAFSATTATGATPLSSAADWTAPTVSAVIANSSGGLGLKTGATYNVYANVTDTGNPASGVSSVKADVSTVTTTQTSVTLSACASACTVGGVTYGYKSAQLTENTAVGTKTWTVTAIDAATNSSGALPFTVSVDNTAPTVGTAVIAHLASGPGVKASGTYNVYGNATDASSGMAQMTANVNNVTTGQTTVAMTACSSACTVAGVTYGFKSAQLTANAGLTNGSKNFTVSATDNAGNTSGTSTFSVTADNATPTATNVQTTDHGGTTSRAQATDVMTLTFSVQMDPDSILSGWTGAGTAIAMRITNPGAGNDTVTFWDSSNTTQLTELGSVSMGRSGYVPTGTTAVFAATMAQATTNVTITLGALTSGSVTTAGGTGTMSWASSSTPTNLVSTPASGNVRAETGGADRDF